MNERLGRLAVRYAFKYLRFRYRREIRIGTGLAALAIALVVYRASRNVPEG